MEKNKKIKMSPAARKLAKQMGINVGELQSASNVIRSKDILAAQQKTEAFERELNEEYEQAVAKTNADLSARYDEILREEKRELSYAAWLEAKTSQTAAREARIAQREEDKLAAKREQTQKAAYKAWAEAKKNQDNFRYNYLDELKRENAKKAAYDSWKAAKLAQTKTWQENIAKREEEKTLAAREAKKKAAYASWAKAKEEMQAQRNTYLLQVESENFWAGMKEYKAAAYEAWLEGKAESDRRYEEFVEAYENEQYEKAYEEYVASLDELNQVSVGKIEFDLEAVEEAMGDVEMSVNDAVTRFVASAVAKSLVDIECPIYDNGLMNIISLTGEKPIKTVKDAHVGEFYNLEYEDAVYFTKDIKVRIWDISVCGLESFFASQGGINVYINLDDDEIDLDVAIDTRVMMDLEALIFLMRMKEYLS